MTATDRAERPDITDHVWHEVVHLDCGWCVPAEVRARLDTHHTLRQQQEGDHALAGGAILTLALAWALITAGIAVALFAPPVTGWHGLAVLLTAGGGGLMWRCLTVAGRIHDRSTTTEGESR